MCIRDRIDADAAIFGNGFGIDVARRVRSIVNYLGTRIKILSLTGKGNSCKFAVGAFPIEDAHRIQTGCMGAEGPSNPIDGSVLTNDAALRVHVVHILRPVFNRRISQSGFIANKKFNTAGV